MPCSDGMGPGVRTEYVEVDNPKLAAALCAILSSLELGTGGIKYFLSSVNWREAGVDREYVEDWWRRHKEQDRKRREREAEQRRLKQVKTTAIIKVQKHLSYEEQRALGLTK
jgi:hypothetical protein